VLPLTLATLIGFSLRAWMRQRTER
jgi:hypothetical protein